LDSRDGLRGACPVFASLAKKNLESLFVVVVEVALEYALSEIAGVNETVARFGISLSTPFMPFVYACKSGAIRNDSFADGEPGVPFGVPVGVVFVLLTLDFRDPDLGVILLFKSEGTGVGPSSFTPVSNLGFLRDNGVVTLGGFAAATLGVRGTLFVVFAAAAERVGMRGRVVPFCLSYTGIFALPPFTPRGLLGGTLIMTLLSLYCNDDRNVDLAMLGLVGVALVSSLWLWLWLYGFSRLFCRPPTIGRMAKSRSASRL
jgi:hypothetical protein